MKKKNHEEYDAIEINNDLVTFAVAFNNFSLHRYTFLNSIMIFEQNNTQ